MDVKVTTGSLVLKQVNLGRGLVIFSVSRCAREGAFQRCWQEVQIEAHGIVGLLSEVRRCGGINASGH